MPKQPFRSLADDLNIIWTIAAKDIIDALANKVVISLIIMVSIFLLLPKMLPFIFNQPRTTLPIYDPGNSPLMAELKELPDIALQKLGSEQDLRVALCGGIHPLIGLVLPADSGQTNTAGEPAEFQGYVCWSKRHQVADLRVELEDRLSQSLGRTVTIQIEGNIVYPPSEGELLLSLGTVNAVLILLTMGISLVPSLLLEEKETKTMQALLVSPASIGQVVIGKALAGLFYILVTAVVTFTISWADVVHWDMVILFVLGGGLFSVAVGLVMGSFFKKPQDMAGWMIAILPLLIGAVVVWMFGMELPALVGTLLPWIPSVALAEILRAAYSETVSTARIGTSLGIILAVSLPLYAIVIWKVRRSDR